jgi:hypothetical protein
MRIRLAAIDPKAERLLPENEPDDSGVGINYADAHLRPIKATLADGRKITAKRRGLKITLRLGDATGEGLLRRLAHGPDVRSILHEALSEAARGLGARFTEEDGALFLDLD